jgi:predicted DsbA family dithiol-disulfide isomerase
MKSTYRIIAAVLLGLLCSPVSAFSQNKSSVPWALLPRVTALDESRKVELMDVLKSEPNYGKCKGTMYQCLIAEKPDMTAVRFANFGAYLVSKGVPAKSLGFLAKERAKFMSQETGPAFTYADSPSLGNEKAKITIAEFAEFKCTYCVALSPILKRLVEDSNGRVRLFFKHFPLKNHPGTFFSSRAAQAAHRQGKFWEMYGLLYKDFSKQSMEDVLEYGRALGMDADRFKTDLEDRKIEDLIERDKMEGVRAKVTGTPTLFINGKMYHLRHDEEFLKDLISEEAERLGLEAPYQDWAYMRQKR